jgi:hypothetical protein
VCVVVSDERPNKKLGRGVSSVVIVCFLLLTVKRKPKAK